MAYMNSQAAANVDGILRRQMPDFRKGQVGATMGRIIVLVLILLVLGAVALVGYAYSGFLQPDVQTVTQPVDLDVD
ncbi:hypothetical protein [Jannaschia sp. CCS1]|uniref:hypothetical protein n=1 Tax=Jannaschia sp. (strain CCS1) TaxID=290400 RepID=UPI00140FC950|nr:hypothetical protein [Jannaschia sp. CCS1]